MKRKKWWIIPLIIILAAALGAGSFAVYKSIELSNAPDPGETAEEYCSEIFSAVFSEGQSPLMEEVSLKPADIPEEPQGKRLYDGFKASLSYGLKGQAVRDGKYASQSISIKSLDIEKLSESLSRAVKKEISAEIEAALSPLDIYNEDRSLREDVLDMAFDKGMSESLSEPGLLASERDFTIEMEYRDKRWQITNLESMREAILGWAAQCDFKEVARKLKSKAASSIEYVPIAYKIEETALSGNVPNVENFTVTTDPEEINSILSGKTALELIGDRELLWKSDTQRIPGTPIYCYLDESILVLCWQQIEAQAVGTYSEVIIADGSQIRRRIADDYYEGAGHKTTSEFAAECRAVLALGGDFYHHDRNCGIVVYNRELCRFEPSSCDCCYITGSGDMLFSYRNQFSSEDEARAFIEENDILYSLCFGPVLIDDGEDVTPEAYQWGEINDHYARSGIGMLDEHHYLAVNINCQMPNHYYLATLRDLADAMQRAGCVKAYTLDGGQTATTVFNNQLINPVQFGWEKPISDVIYFATAIPEK